MLPDSLRRLQRKLLLMDRVLIPLDSTDTMRTWLIFIICMWVVLPGLSLRHLVSLQEPIAH